MRIRASRRRFFIRGNRCLRIICIIKVLSRELVQVMVVSITIFVQPIQLLSIKLA